MDTRMSLRRIALATVLLPLVAQLQAAPVTSEQAVGAAEGWLRLSAQHPLSSPLRALDQAAPEALTDPTGRTVGFVIRLTAGGYIITSADTEIDPIIAFSRNGRYVVEPENPIHSVLSYDLSQRAAAATDKSRVVTASDSTTALKWRTYTDAAVSDKDTVVTLANDGRTLLSDLRIAPLLQTQWNQSDGEDLCFTTYTPNHYKSGSVPTAWGQIMRYHGYPTNGIGERKRTIKVDGVEQSASTRGGDGDGGPYRWDLMSLRASANLAEANRQAIGTLVSDIGIAISTNVGGIITDYSASGTVSYMPPAALTNVFGYASAFRFDQGANPTNAINPNLDARLPVVLSLAGTSEGHAVVCDGYGYQDGSLYHHLNMGWGGAKDLWYALPDVQPTGYSFTNITYIYANVLPSGSGEIVSGRVLADGLPVSHATVTLSPGGRIAVTDGEGIYAFAKVSSATAYTLSAQKTCYTFTSLSVTTGTSTNHSTTCGNRWNLTFDGTLAAGCHLVSGVVTNESGAGLGGVTLTFSGATVTAETDLEGNWRVALSNGWSGSVTPDVGPGYTVPTAQTVSTLQTDTAGISFRGIPVRYVRAAAQGDATGRSWAHAWTNLIAALDDAPANAEIWVSGGVYTPPAYSRRTSFIFPAGRRAYGGFAGFETRREQRNWTTNVTLLSGDIGTLGDFSDNCKTVVFGAPGARLDGFTVTGGNSDSVDGLPQYVSGGGIYAPADGVPPESAKQTLLVQHCTVVSNRASNGSAAFGCFLRNTLLRDNHAINLAVIQLSRLENCTVVNNTSDSFLEGLFQSIAVNCIIWNNKSHWAGSESNCTYTCDAFAPAGFNNITSDPLFVGAATNNFRLQSSSPCIDAGTNLLWMADARDLAGYSRVWNDVADMGAYEYQILHPAYAITAVAADEAGFAVSFETFAGWTYALRYKESLSDDPWADLTPPVTLSGNGSVQTLSDPGWETQPRRFYKVAAWQ